jgi:probable F420-dependent oxidoreductase
MTPTFSPGPNPHGAPPIFLGALGPRLTRAAAEHADGLLVMPFSTKRFLHQVTMAAVRAGLQRAGRREEEFAVVPEVIVATGATDAEREAAEAATRMLLGFYASTPAYAPVLAEHGWQELQPELNALSKQGRWSQMGALIDDEVLHTIAACGTPAQVAAHIRERVEGISDTVCVYQAAPVAPALIGEIVTNLA